MKLSNRVIHQASFFLTAFLATVALVAVIPVSYDTLMTEKKCPSVGLIPACYIVTLGYSLILLSLLTQKKCLFIMGWLLVFLLALSGAIAELFGLDVCPKTASGIPMCYFSLVFSVVIAMSYSLWNKSKIIICS